MKVLSRILGGIGIFLMLYTGVLIGVIAVAGKDALPGATSSFVDEKIHLGLTISYAVGTCGFILLCFGLALWLVTRRQLIAQIPAVPQAEYVAEKE